MNLSGFLRPIERNAIPPSARDSIDLSNDRAAKDEYDHESKD